MSIKGCFIDHEQEPIFERLRAHGINECLIPGEHSPAANPEWVRRMDAAGFKVTVMFAWNWFGGFSTGAKFAEYASERLKQIGYAGAPGSPAVNPEVMLDIEKGAGLNEFNYVDWVVDCLTRWRQLRPTRATTLSLEAMQGGLFKDRPDKVLKVLSLVGGIIPQHYTGGEKRMAEDVTLKDLEDVGFPRGRIRGFYLARELPMNWDGYAWTQGKLP